MMTIESSGTKVLDYKPCRYGRAKLLFRGPKRKLDGPFIAAFGGSETYGKYIPRPWTDCLEESLGLPVVNFGYMNAGPDAFHADPTLLEAAHGAKVSIVQLMGAQNMSNRMYEVHPRRNDRLVRCSPLMKALYSEVDFAEFHYTGQMLARLLSLAPDKFLLVEQELKRAWVARMRTLLGRIEGKTLLLWITDFLPPGDEPDPIGAPPAFIDARMVEAIRDHATGLVQVRPSSQARASGLQGMIYPPLEEPAARRIANPAVQREVAEALSPVLQAMLQPMMG